MPIKDMTPLKKAAALILVSIFHVPLAFANFTDPSDPKTAEMDKEEARLNEQNVHLSALNEALLNLKRIHLVLVKRQIISVDGESWKEGARMTLWKGTTNDMLIKLAVMVDKYLDKDRETQLENLTPEALAIEMENLDVDLLAIETDQANEKIYFNHLSDTLFSVNEILARVYDFDPTILNRTAGTGYEETIGLVNEYAQRIRDAVYNLNNELEVLSHDELQTVVASLIQAIRQRNAIYALGIAQLADTVAEAEATLSYAEFLNSETSLHKSLIGKTSAIDNAFDSGRVARAGENYAAANELLIEFKNAFVNKLGDIGDPLDEAQDTNYSGPYLSFRQLYRTRKNNIENNNIDLTPGNVSLTQANDLASRFRVYMKGRFDQSYSGIKASCTETVSESRRSSFNCKLARELSVFYNKDLTQMSTNDTARIAAGTPEQDIIIERIALIEGKLKQVYVVND